MHTKVTATLFSLLLIVSCSITPTTENYVKQLKPKVIGKNIEVILQSWGYPEKILKISENKRVFDYSFSFTISGSCSGTDGNINCTGDDYYYCNQSFEVDKNNIIQRVSISGNSCSKSCEKGKSKTLDMCF